MEETQLLTLIRPSPLPHARGQGAMHSPHERWLLLLILLVFIGVNLLTAARSPTVWEDEVQLADPAANLLLKGSFTTSGYAYSSRHEIFSGNTAAYSALLYLWIKIFGFTVTAVRSLNYVLVAGAAIFVWSA